MTYRVRKEQRDVRTRMQACTHCKQEANQMPDVPAIPDRTMRQRASNQPGSQSEQARSAIHVDQIARPNV
jgi:hypothetical protein